jgi:hypothetical protein
MPRLVGEDLREGVRRESVVQSVVQSVVESAVESVVESIVGRRLGDDGLVRRLEKRPGRTPARGRAGRPEKRRRGKVVAVPGSHSRKPLSPEAVPRNPDRGQG